MKQLFFKSHGWIVFLLVFLSSCEVIGSIFKAGVWIGILIVVVIIIIILWLVGKARK